MPEISGPERTGSDPILGTVQSISVRMQINLSLVLPALARGAFWVRRLMQCGLSALGTAVETWDHFVPHL